LRQVFTHGEERIARQYREQPKQMLAFQRDASRGRRITRAGNMNEIAILCSRGVAEIIIEDGSVASRPRAKAFPLAA
jgi:hypothetical protein